MLTVFTPETEYYNSVEECFVAIPAQTLKLEHSLIAISKWEAKWMKPFLGPAQKTTEEIMDYIKCMIVDDGEYRIDILTPSNIEEITKYIESKQTATTVNTGKGKKGPNREIVTSELIYYWMVAFNIPFECQYWHLNRLLMLIEVCNVKNNPPKKENPKDILARNAALNAARKKSMKTSG